MSDTETSRDRKRNGYEGKCCDAILRILEEEHGAVRTNVVRDTPEAPGVELTCSIGNEAYVLEHTLIEPFTGNQRDDIDFGRVLDDRFEAEVADLLDVKYAYDLTVDVYAFRGKNKKELRDIRRALVAWVRSSVQSLPIPVGSRQAWIMAERPQAPVRVRLSRHLTGYRGGTLLAGRFAPPDLEDLRAERLRKALLDKGPKLEAARSPGARTVLVLENRDVSLTNVIVVSQNIERIAATLRHIPDDVFVVDIVTGSVLYVTQIRSLGKPCLLLGRGTNRWEYPIDALADI